MGLFGPLFALFVSSHVTDVDLIIATDIASAIYLIVKSVAQIPAAWVIDKIRGERDDFFIMVGGAIIAALIPLAYLTIDTALGLYAFQAFYGLVGAATFPSYMAIFTRHIDHGKEGTEWGGILHFGRCINGHNRSYWRIHCVGIWISYSHLDISNI